MNKTRLVTEKKKMERTGKWRGKKRPRFFFSFPYTSTQVRGA